MPHASGTCSAGLATLRIWSGPKVPGWMPSGPNVGRETWGPAGLRRPTPRHPRSFARSTHGGGRVGRRACHAGSRPPARAATPGRRVGRAANEAHRGRGSAKACWEGCCSTGRGGREPGRESRYSSRAEGPHLLPRPVRRRAARPLRHQMLPVRHRAAQPVRHQVLLPVRQRAARLIGHQAVRPLRHQATGPVRHHMERPASPRPIRPVRTLDGSRGPRVIRVPRHRKAQFLSHPVVERTRHLAGREPRHLAGREPRHLAGREPRHLAGSVPGRWEAVAPCPRSDSLPTG
jgi:hypothetical protein